MKFMTRLWALLVLIGVCSFGSQALASTSSGTLACKQAGFAASPFSGSVKQKERQAKNLAVGTPLLVNGVVTPLPANSSLWELCAGPSLEEQLASAKVQINELTLSNTDLKGRLENIWKVAGPNNRELKILRVKSENQLQELEAAESVNGLLWLMVLILTALLFVSLFRNSLRNVMDDLRHPSVRKKGVKRSVDFTPDPAKDQVDDTAPDSSPRHAI